MISAPRVCPCMIHKGQKSDDPVMNDVLEQVRNRNWTTVLGGGGRDDNADHDRPSWAFTVGLWHSFGYPELAICGPDRRELMYALKQGCLALEYEVSLHIGRVDHELAWPGIRVGRVDESWHGSPLMRIPAAFYAGGIPEYRQFVRADAKGIFPGVEGYAGTPDDQPDLALPWRDHPAGFWQNPETQA